MSILKPHHIVHVLYRFAAGGLENVIVQLINGLPHDQFRHTVVALTTLDPAFMQRIQRQDVDFIALNKQPGQPFKLYPAMYRLLKRIQPDVFHSCNIAALEFAPVAAWAGVRLRVHAEHGWDVADPDGSNRKYQVLRRLYQRFVHDFVVVSDQLKSYLLDVIGIEPDRVQCIPNGVDTKVFMPTDDGGHRPAGYPFEKGAHWVVGTVGRLEPIKNQTLLAQAFVRLVDSQAPEVDRLRLAVVGAGPLKQDIQRILSNAGMADRLWLPGSRGDIAHVLRSMDCFVLPSLAEGTSCTLQEAMATALPIVATDVGGNADLLQGGRLGRLVPSSDAAALCDALREAYIHPQVNHAARQAVLMNHGLDVVLSRYQALFSRG